MHARSRPAELSVKVLRGIDHTIEVEGWRTGLRRSAHSLPQGRILSQPTERVDQAISIILLKYEARLSIRDGRTGTTGSERDDRESHVLGFDQGVWHALVSAGHEQNVGCGH